ncbi:hypothetical protein WJX84_006363 [Apatococcus fuscideae]|uniref:Uncharacterized protein n=1 Tax=Apatococcus fuscideae TaxID=2026836 RepID=A0AAW1SZK8_9CHLO
MQSGPATPEQEEQLQLLQEALRQVEAQQLELKKSVDLITQKKQKDEVERVLTSKEKTRQAAEKERARTTKARPAEKVRMSDLREANKAELDTDDLEARQKAVQPIGFIPSGGLTGFRVASDLAKMDFAPREDIKEEPEEEEPPKHVTPAWLRPAPKAEPAEGS